MTIDFLGRPLGFLVAGSVGEGGTTALEMVAAEAEEIGGGDLSARFRLILALATAGP